MLRALLSAAAGFLLAVQGASAAADPAFGRWLVENGKAIIEFGPCNERAELACGKIVWLKEPHDDTGALKVDVNNPDPSLQAEPLCGLQLIGGFKRDATGSWEDGWIYNARDGETYDAIISIASDGTLEVRGYVGITLLGKSQHWTRVSDATGGCPG